MAKEKMIDVHNQSNRDYTSPSGVELKSKSTAPLPAAEAEKMMKGYPRDLISLDSLRSAPASQSIRDQHSLIVQLQARIAELENNPVTDDSRNRISELEDSLKQAFSVNAELAQKYDKSVSDCADIAMKLTEATVKIGELEKALEDAKKMATEAYKELDKIKAQK